MKKLCYVLPGLLLAAVLIAVMCIIGVHNAPVPQPPTLSVLDARGQVMVTLSSPEELYDDPRWAYLEYALDEAAWGVAGNNGITEEEAVQLLFRKNCSLKTAFDPAVFAAMENAGEKWGDQFPIGCAITDLKGNLVAIYSTEGEKNEARVQTSPYSTLKPLSVYAPAIEAGISHWSVRYEDSPYKQLPDGSNWPTNATGTYSGEKVLMHMAVKQSLNTVAVKSLSDLGVNNAIAFLRGKFPIDLATEVMRSEEEGEEEIIGNIALGYLQTGVTTVDMAGYYQIFAAGGTYTQVHALTAVTDAGGNVLYAPSAESWQVVSPDTADIVNRMLQGVASEGGTGEGAAISAAEIAGQTGVRDDRSVNWFVGVAPGYSCAVRHGQSQENLAPEIFAGIMEEIYGSEETRVTFRSYGDICQIDYCAQSAMAASEACPTTETGYYAPNIQLPLCKNHTKQESEKGDLRP